MRSFSSALANGHAAERKWVESMRTNGRSVAHGKKLVVAKHCKKNDHCETPDALALFAIEIKERSLAFDSPETYPYDTVFVDDLRGLDRERTQNLIYVFLSKPTGKWVWLTILDMDESWTRSVTFDRSRGHEIPVLVAPRDHLRPSESLINLVYPHLYLDLVDGPTEAFVSGGGETEERERYVAKTHPDVGGRTKKAPAKTRKHMG